MPVSTRKLEEKEDEDIQRPPLLADMDVAARHHFRGDAFLDEVGRTVEVAETPSRPAGDSERYGPPCRTGHKYQVPTSQWTTSS